MLDHSRPRVLIADDYEGILTALNRLLGFCCDVVGLVGNGHLLFEAAARLQPDVILVDVGLPDVDGLEAARRIKAAGLEAKVIVLTAADDPGMEQQAFAAGASAFVLKHRVAEDLLPAIERVWGRPLSDQSLET